MNSTVSDLVSRSFKKIFKNVASEFQTDVKNIQLGIYYEKGIHKYKAFNNFQNGKDVKLEDYMDIITSSICGGAIDSTMAQGGSNYTKELSEKLNREVNIDEINIIMCYNDSGLPKAVLMVGKERIRLINIEKEF